MEAMQMIFENGENKIVDVGENANIQVPEVIANVKFDARRAGVYFVRVYENGDWRAEFKADTETEEE